MTDDVRKLLGGYSTGTLSEPEKKALYEAALEDPALFEALADEQALKELLDDPGARAQVLQALETRPFSMGRVVREWLERPTSKALVATAVVLVAFISFRVLQDQKWLEGDRWQAPARQEIAMAPTPRQSSPEAASGAPAGRDESTSPAPRPNIGEQRQARDGDNTLTRGSGSNAPVSAAGAAANASDGANPIKAAEQASAPSAQAAVSPPASMSDGVSAAGTSPAVGTAPKPGPVEVARLKTAELDEKADGSPEASARRSGMDAPTASGFRSGIVRPRAAAPSARPEGSPAPTAGAPAARGTDASGAETITFRLERRNSAGTFTAVDPKTVLERNEEARLVLHTPASGMVSVMLADRQNLATYTVHAGQNLTIPVPAGVRSMVIGFSGSTLLRNLVAPGSVAAEADQKREAQPAKQTSPTSIEIPIQRK